MRAMRVLLLAIAFAGAVCVTDTRSIHVDASNKTTVASPAVELNTTDIPPDAGENRLSEKEIDDILFVMEHSKNYTSLKAVEETLENREPGLVKKVKKSWRAFNGTLDGLSQPAQTYVASVVFRFWAGRSNWTFTDIGPDLKQKFDAEKIVRTLIRTDVGAHRFKKLDPVVQKELADAFPLIADLMRSEKFHAKFAEQLDAE